MKSISTGTIGVDQGTTALFSHYDSGGDMWTGEGEREVRLRIPFSQPFRDIPSVHLSFALTDIDQTTSQRTHLIADNIDTEGFEAVFQTWGDTRVARIWVSWMAIGAVTSDDDWDLG